MSPHTILLLLLASSAQLTRGDETDSWGKVSSGPSESECRPYIEKALQGASIPDSTSEPGVDDDDGGGREEGENLQAEGSEIHLSEILSDSKETEEEQGIDDQSARAESDENERVKESSEIVVEEEMNEISNEESPDDPRTDEESAETLSVPLESEDTESVEDGGTNIHSSVENESLEVNKVEPETESIDENEEVEAINEASREDTSNEAREIVDESLESQESDHLNPENEPRTLATEEHNTDETVDSSVSAEQNPEGQSEVAGEEGSGESTESKIVENIMEERTTSQEETASNEEAQTEDGSETVSDQSQEIADNREQTEEIEESSETLEKLDEKSDEANEKNVQEETDAQVEESREEQEIAKQDEYIIGDEDMVDTNQTSQSEDSSGSAMETADKEVEGPLRKEEESTETEEETIPYPNNNQSRSSQAPEETNNAPLDESKESTEAEQTIAEGGEEAVPEVELAEPSPEEGSEEPLPEEESGEPSAEKESGEPSAEKESGEPSPEEELSMDIEIPEKLRSREHMSEILHLNAEDEEIGKLLEKAGESTLRDLKKLYDVAIKPLELLYKYRDLSNRHFGDPEIFSKPLILFMGPWSGGKSTIINYLLENEYKKTALRTGAEPSPAYFNIVMWGDSEEVLDGTQLAADWTFSGLQKFGQGLLDRLRGLRLNHPLLEKVNIVEIPGILEIRKQVERLFPFNDACQWFIDRADIIFLVYDPSKLDVGPETEAILDQLKGREMQTRIILNKADQVKAEELMRVQGTLIWNISPLMSSTEPPAMYTTSLWSLPYESGSPARLLYAQEKAFLKDLKDAVDKRVENKIASARRFAVRVRNHAKMVDCYLTTYYNHKSFFGNKKKISDEIIEHPQNYHIYEGLSTLTNISRYDLPDPDVYRDFFRLNPVYEFQQLSSTCTYFRGCPINRLDVAIAYDLPELVGKYKKSVDQILNSIKK